MLVIRSVHVRVPTWPHRSLYHVNIQSFNSVQLGASSLLVVDLLFRKSSGRVLLWTRFWVGVKS